MFSEISVAMLLRRIVSALFVSVLFCTASFGEDPLVAESLEAIQKAVAFFHDRVADEGGYVYQVSDDLKLREGEGIAAPGTVWVQPPSTPAVGMAMLDAYRRTGERRLLEAAKNAGHCLVRGQLKSGGWQAHIDFSSKLRPQLAYRVDRAVGKKAKNLSSFDDDKTQSAVRFLCKLDATLKFNDKVIGEATLFALDSILKSQFPNCGWMLL